MKEEKEEERGKTVSRPNGRLTRVRDELELGTCTNGEPSVLV